MLGVTVGTGTAWVALGAIPDSPFFDPAVTVRTQSAPPAARDSTCHTTRYDVTAFPVPCVELDCSSRTRVGPPGTPCATPVTPR